MRRDLVEEDERGGAGEGLNEARFGEHEADEKGFLLAGGAVGCRRLFGTVNDIEVAEMGSDKGPPGGPVALACFAEEADIIVLDLNRRPLAQRIFERSFELQDGKGEGAVGALMPCRFDEAREPGDGIEARGGNGDCRFPHLLLEPRKMRWRSFPDLEQPVPLAHGAIEPAAWHAHLRIDGKREPIEKAPALG